MNLETPRPIRVVVADDHPIVRAGIQNELVSHSDIQVIGEATNGDEALQMALALQPDVLVLDVNMPGLRIMDVMRGLREIPAAQVLVLTMLEDEEHVISLLAAGARGYLLKDEQPAIIARAVRAVAQGTLWLSARVAHVVLERAIDNVAVESPQAILTSRELQVLRMMARGWSNSKIAQDLCITEATVKFHVGNIYDKLSVTSRVEAVLYAARWALVDLKSD